MKKEPTQSANKTNFCQKRKDFLLLENFICGYYSGAYVDFMGELDLVQNPCSPFVTYPYSKFIKIAISS